MADDMQRLIVSLEAKTTKFLNEMNKANATATKRANAIEGRFKKLNSTVSAQFTRLGGTFAAAFVSTQALRGAKEMVDAATRIQNALKVAGLSGDDLTRVYDDLYASAQRNAAPLEALVELYSRASLVQKELGVSTQDLLRFTDNVAVALRVSGKSAQESSGALLQLSQALGSGIVRAEEFNSLLEGALPIAQAAASGLEEAGGSVAKLRQLVVDGKVSSEAFFRAFEAGSATLTQKVANAELTVSQGFVRLQNVLVDVAGKFDKATGTSTKTGEALNDLAEVIQGVGDYMVRVANGPIGTFIGKLGALDEKAKALFETLNKYTLNDEIWSAISGIVAPQDQAAGSGIGNATTRGDRQSVDPVSSRIGSAFSTLDTGSKTVSLSDYRVPGNVGKGSKRSLSDFEREVALIKEHTAAIQSETQAMAGLNPLVDDYGYALEKARAAQELETAAKRAGLELTPELRETIDTLSTSYAQASVAAEQLAESQARARETAAEFRDIGKDVTKGLISDLKNGVSAADALSNALGRVADRLLDVALNSIFDQGGAGGGLFSAIGSLFKFRDGGMVPAYAGGGMIGGRGGPRSDSNLARVSRGEFIVNAASTKRARPLLEQINAGRIPGFADGGIIGSVPMPTSAGASAGAMDVRVTVGVAADGNGNLLPFVQSVSQSVSQRNVQQAVAPMARAVADLGKRTTPDALLNAVSAARASRPNSLQGR